MGIDQGFYTIRGCYVENKNRVDYSVRKSSNEYKQRRKILRGKHKRKGDKNKEDEGVTYEAGKF